MNVLSLFSGIGGLDLGLQRAGMTIAGQVEIDPWCRKILAKHWPEVPRHDDVRTAAGWWVGHVADTEDDRARRWQQQPEGSKSTRPMAYECERRELRFGPGRPAVDLVCGGFPCQPVSVAGKGLAQADSRWLWPAFADVIRHLRPSWVLVENVPGLLARGMGDVLGDLAAIGYDAEWDCVPAAFIGAPHIRNRVWIVAYPAELLSDGCHGQSQREVPQPGDHSRAPGDVADAASDRRATEGQRATPRHLDRSRDLRLGRQAHHASNTDREPLGWTPVPRCEPGHWATEPDVGRVAHGIPRRVDRLRGLGNAVVPQVAEHIGRLIIQAERAA